MCVCACACVCVRVCVCVCVLERGKDEGVSIRDTRSTEVSFAKEVIRMSTDPLYFLYSPVLPLLHVTSGKTLQVTCR